MQTINAVTLDTHELQTLIQSYHPVIAIESVEEERVVNLVQHAANAVGMSVMEWSVTRGLSRSHMAGNNRWTNEYAPTGAQSTATYEGSTDPEKLLEILQENSAKAIYLLKDFTQHLDHPKIIRQFRETAHQFSQSRSTLILVGPNLEIPAEIKAETVYYEITLPSQEELHQVINDVVKSLRINQRINIHVHEDDIQNLVTALSGMTLRQAKQVIAYAAVEDGELGSGDVKRILDRKAQIIRKEGILEFFPTTQKPLKLGGFDGLKRWLQQTSIGFSATAKEFNLPAPKGILIVGIQGCGKSLAAKTIAQAWQMPLLKLDAGRLYNKYVGESELNFRRAIGLAESMAPAVLWIDEIEKSLGSQSGADSDGGLSQRLFGSFLTWMQEKSQSVFVIATANDISKLPPELLRKGRFDEIFFVDLPDPQERAQIWHIHLLKHRQELDRFNAQALIAATDGFSGAEIEQAVISGMYRALHRQQPLSTEILLEAIQDTVPLSIARKNDVERLRTIAKTNFVSVK
jgi:ATP-dependent Zn protease